VYDPRVGHPELTTRTADPRVFARIIRAALRRRLVHLPLDAAPGAPGTHQLHVLLEGDGARAVWIVAEPAGAASGGLYPLRLQPRSSTQAAQLYALAHLGGTSSSYPPDEAPPSARADSQAPAIVTTGVPSERPIDLARGWGARALAAPLVPQEAASPEPRLVGGRYRLEAVLGEGAAGVVHRALDLRAGRVVAVKVLHAAAQREAETVKRFKAEARAASRLDHVNVTGVYDAGEEPGGELYLVMELVAGRTLGVLLEEQGALPQARAADIGAQIAAALAHAHEAGIVHRDVKPDNVMLLPPPGGDARRGDLVKVCDFGVAKFMDPDPENQTVLGRIFGSPAYMSPEQAAGRSIDWRSDLYALGVTLYEVLTGRLPLDGASIVELIYKHARETPASASAFVPGLDPALDALVARLLAKAPFDRGAGAREVRAELRAIADRLGARTGL
jgi:serine/threonine-protein kinase